METLDFFTTAQRMRGYRGDTFPEFLVKTDAPDLTGCTMRLVLEEHSTAGSVAFTKDCTPHEFEDGAHGFSVQLTSEETAALDAGSYTMHFIMENAGGRAFRKLVGTLVLLDVPEEG